MVPRSVLVLSGALLILACGGEEKGEKKAEVKPEGPETAQVAKTTGPGRSEQTGKGCFSPVHGGKGEEGRTRLRGRSEEVFGEGGCGR
ncbi:MAG: hypothetical protein Q9N34_05080 [Aquificota bacterium]|nr:hypothetical protein [Aquificota bacterium]